MNFKSNSSDIVGYLCNKCVFIYFSWLPAKWISYYLKHSQQTVRRGLAKDRLTQSPVTSIALLGIEATGIMHHTASLSPLGINCMDGLQNQIMTDGFYMAINCDDRHFDICSMKK